jgi:hypothetical protein
MPLRPSLLTRESLEVGEDLGLRSQLDEAISQIKMPTMLEDGISQIKSLATSMPMEFEASPMPKIPDLRDVLPGYGEDPEPAGGSVAGPGWTPTTSASTAAVGAPGAEAAFSIGKSPEGQARVYQTALGRRGRRSGSEPRHLPVPRARRDARLPVVGQGAGHPG